MTQREDFIGGAKPTRLATGMGAADASLTVTAGGLATWQPVVNGRFAVIIARGEADEEHLYATAVAGDALTGLDRGPGVDGTAAQTHLAGATVEHGLFARHVDEPNEFLALPTAAGQIAVSTGAGEWGVTDDLDLSTGALLLPSAVAPGQTAEGSVIWDSNDDWLTVGTGAGRKTLVDTDSAQSMIGKTIGSSIWQDGELQMDDGILLLPQSTGPTQTAEGSVVWDTNDDLLTVGTGAGRKTMVDTNTAQTLTGKTLTAPAIADFTSAQHDHGDADDGGAIVIGAIPAAIPRGLMPGGLTTTFTSRTSTGSESAAMLTVTVTVTAGQTYRVEGSARVESDTANDTAEVRIKTAVGTATGTGGADAASAQLTGTGGSGSQTLYPRTHFTATGSGTVTFTLVVIRTAGTGTVTGAAGNGVPFLSVTHVGVAA